MGDLGPLEKGLEELREVGFENAARFEPADKEKQ